MALIKSENSSPVKYNSVSEILKDVPLNEVIGDNYIKAFWTINNPLVERAVCSLSGGSDSDIMLDIIWRCDKDNKVSYVFMDTGIEYLATKEHLEYLEEKYSIKIERLRGMPVPLATSRYGVPFLNKNVSTYIHRLQYNGFKFEDKPYEELILEYPHCKSALEWWCNRKKSPRLNISWNRYLKEFLIAYPPSFPISSMCCDKAKKDIAHQIAKKRKVDLMIVGLRKAEGGARSVRFHSCFSSMDESGSDYASYRPVFWYKAEDKQLYEEHYSVCHSRCYSEYGLPRTGCACCPFGLNFEKELEAVREHEPLLYKAALNIFGKSYDYTRKYKEFANQLKNEKEI